MKRNIYYRSCMKIFTCLLFLVIATSLASAKKEKASRSVVSYVDTSLDESQKYVLKVDNKPFYMMNVQVRFDKLRYRWGWNIDTCNRLVMKAADLGFNTLSIPIHWREIETEKDKFDWTTLDLYLDMTYKSHLRAEILWFSQNSGGHVQWLKTNELRTPDYVLYSPQSGDINSFSTEGSSTKTTSDYVIRRDISDYTLDLNDKKLCAREAYVLGIVMKHIALWDAKKGNPHTVIGVQLGNEVRSFPSTVIVDYMNELGRAVKESPYSVWTRMNCTYADLYSVLYCNEKLRSTKGTNIDFVGFDAYVSNDESMDAYINNLCTDIPCLGKNFKMIMEAGAGMSNIAQVQLAALACNDAFDYYDLCGPDDSGLFVKGKETEFVARGSYIEDVKAVNMMLGRILADVATKASGYGLFVHNWNGQSLLSTTGVEGISFTPGYINSQALSIVRSSKEIILATTKGGTFLVPDSLNIISTGKGYFNDDNVWEQKGPVDYRKTENNMVMLKAEAGDVIRLLCSTRHDTYKIYQAERAEFGDGVVLESDMTQCAGFAGDGYLNFPLSGGYVRWEGIDGQNGGNKIIRLRYSNGNTKTNIPELTVNGVKRQIKLSPTGPWSSYYYLECPVQLNPGKNNTIELKSIWTGAGHIDELQVMK